MNIESSNMISVDITVEKITAKETPESSMQDFDGYPEFLTLIQKTYQENCDKGNNLFSVKTEDNLFDLYLDSLPEERRQHYNCRACKKFFDNYGNLAIIDENNKIVPLFWNGTNQFTENFIFTKALFTLETAVKIGKIDKVFYSSETVWGIPESNGWNHIYVKPYSKHIFGYQKLYTSEQFTALKVQQRISLLGSIQNYRKEEVEIAIEYLKSGKFFNPEKVLPIAEKFHELLIAWLDNKNSTDRNVIVWKYVTDYPEAFNYIGSGMLGTLLDDIKLKIPYQEVMNKFNYKMDPKQYLRPQATSLSEGNVKRAEEIITKLDIAKSLPRRFAAFDEIKEYCQWLPNAKVDTEDVSEGVFGKLLKKEKIYTELPPVTLSWKAFKERWSQYDSIGIFIPNARIGFTSITTSVDSEAPPIIQWDKAARNIGKKNTFSSYGYVKGSAPNEYNVKVGLNTIVGISPTPSHFIPEVKLDNMTYYDIFYVKDARDLKYDGGIGLFPEILISELHEIRSTMEAYSNNEMLIGRENNTANGIIIGEQNCTNYQFEVKYKNFTQTIKIGAIE